MLVLTSVMSARRRKAAEGKAAQEKAAQEKVKPTTGQLNEKVKPEIVQEKRHTGKGC